MTPEETGEHLQRHCIDFRPDDVIVSIDEHGDIICAPVFSTYPPAMLTLRLDRDIADDLAMDLLTALLDPERLE
ncbi:MAG: hypothetical protein OXG74_14835 [Acidobacteria bacterium]|nr:hypothetical protein [Acidobacteriota bacterium]